jgi:multidrug efflux pump subunit AcrA (membrane-fusion protein)
MISEKNARKLQAEADAMNALGVAQESLNKASDLLEEKHIALTVAKNQQESLKIKFAQANDNVMQTLEHAFISIRRARQLIEQITLGSNTRTGIALNDDNIGVQLGLLDYKTRFSLSYAFSELDEAEKKYRNSNQEKQKEIIYEVMEHAVHALFKTADLLASTPSVPLPQPGLYTELSLTSLNNKVLSAQHDILTAKEKFEDANNAFLTLTTSEPALYSAWKSGSNNPNVQSNKVQMLTAQMQTAEQNLSFVESQQNLMTEKSENMVHIANAMLAAEYAKSGHKEIRSPFSGIVSKRFITVGTITMPSMSAFELVDVETTLSKKAKQEIQFGIPEHIQSSIAVGNTVEFFLPENEEKAIIAEITRKSPQVDLQSRTVIVQAKVPDELNLPHQSNIRVRVIDQSTPLFRIPSFSVKRNEDNNVIWILNPETKIPETIKVTVKSEDGEFAEVSGDIDEDTVIILDPPDLITQISNTRIFEYSNPQSPTVQ